MSPRLSTSNISCADDAAKLFRDAPAHAATLPKGGEVDVLRCPGAIIQIQRGPASPFSLLFLPVPAQSVHTSREAADTSGSANGCSAPRGVEFCLRWSLSSRGSSLCSCGSCCCTTLPLSLPRYVSDNDTASPHLPSFATLSPPLLRHHLHSSPRSLSSLLLFALAAQNLAPPHSCARSRSITHLSHASRFETF